MEIDEDNHLPMATREAILSLYEELQDMPHHSTTTSTTTKDVAKTTNAHDCQETKKQTSGEDGWSVANLHHLLQLIEAIRRDTCYLQLTMGQAASLVTFEACRVFSNLAPDDTALRKKISVIIENHFDEVSSSICNWKVSVVRICYEMKLVFML